MRAVAPKRPRRRSVFRVKSITLTDHEAYALAVLMHSLAGLGAETVDWLAGRFLPLGEERSALPSACRRMAECLAANGWDVGAP
jgi:hypothetical protein